MRMLRRGLLILLAAMAVSACVTTQAIQLGAPGRYPPVDPEQVQVFLKEADVAVKFDKIAVIDAQGDYTVADNARMIKAMKKKAAKLGANAVILGEFKDPSTGDKIMKEVLGIGAERRGRVLAIRLLE